MAVMLIQQGFHFTACDQKLLYSLHKGSESTVNIISLFRLEVALNARIFILASLFAQDGQRLSGYAVAQTSVFECSRHVLSPQLFRGLLPLPWS